MPSLKAGTLFVWRRTPCARCIGTIPKRQRDCSCKQRKSSRKSASRLVPSQPSIGQGMSQDAMKEYAEAQITAALLAEANLPTPESLKVEDAAYLNALAEAGSELRRDVLDRLRADREEIAEYLLMRMDEIYGVLVTVDFPDAITGGLRRTTDQFRAVLERTRGDVTVAMRQHRLELALRLMDDRGNAAFETADQHFTE